MIEGITRNQKAELRREVKSEMASAKVKLRCRGIYRHQGVRAETFQIAAPDYSYEDLLAQVLNVLGTSCPYCGKKITPGNFSIDHEVPLSRGGKMTLGNSTVIDVSCNNKKGALTGDEFRALLDFMKVWDVVAQADVLTRLGIGGRWKH